MSPSPPRSHQRRFRRRTVRVLVDFRDAAGIRCEYATTLGVGGLFIETEEFLEIGSPIKVRFRLPDSAQVHEIEARVAWHQRAEAGETTAQAPGMGIEFLDTAAAATLARDLDRLVETP